ncbi:DUF4249 family protein [Haliscomenobacter sp.]|uniref:DUF4249 family protein n=1 Tax=Haliscomenobacter sp. TaxID=2717303 RepID=UPI003592E877
MRFVWALLLLTCVACTTDFDLEGDFESLPVVYAFINKQDTAHYVRVERSFLTAGGDATQQALDPDNLYFPNAVVELEKLGTTQKFVLTRVDGNLEGYAREEGPFAKAPNYLYKIKANQLNLKGGEILKVTVTPGEGLTPASAETSVLSDLQSLDRPASPVTMVDYNRSITFAWNAPITARLFDLRLRIHYRESTSSNTFVNKTLEWPVVKDLERADEELRVAYTITGEQFYKFLASNIDGTVNRRRVFDGFDVLITAGGKEMADFVRISRANLGITSSQVSPKYSNVRDGVGVFSSRASLLRTGLQLSGPSSDSLRLGKFTKLLGFQ